LAELAQRHGCVVGEEMPDAVLLSESGEDGHEPAAVGVEGRLVRREQGDLAADELSVSAREE
jgi:hypothetical protein